MCCPPPLGATPESAPRELPRINAGVASEADASADWLDGLRAEVEAHPAVNHSLLRRLATESVSREELATFGLQHHALVGCFTTYMEQLLIHAPDAEQKLWLAKVLVDEYGEGSDGEDHATLYRAYLRKLGVPTGLEDTIPLCREVWEFIGLHLQLCSREPFLVGLGALGPGHEWAIPRMFAQIIPGLERAGLSYDDRLYFDLHTEQDIEHAKWMTESLRALGTTEELHEQVRLGARLSLEARAGLWSAIERELEPRRPRQAEKERAADERCESPGHLGALKQAVTSHFRGEAWPVELPKLAVHS